MTDTPADAAEQPHPFDPALTSRIDDFISAYRETFADADTARLATAHGGRREWLHLTFGDLVDLRARDAYAEKTRLELAEACARLRQERDDALAEVDRLKGAEC